VLFVVSLDLLQLGQRRTQQPDIGGLDGLDPDAVESEGACAVAEVLV